MACYCTVEEEAVGRPEVCRLSAVHIRRLYNVGS